MSVAGPNCAGIANFTTDFVAYGTMNFADLDDIHRGDVALLSASGGLGNTIFTYCQERGVGVSHLIGLGNETITTIADHLEVLVEDPAVAVFGGYIEAIRDPERFFTAADRAIAANKPVVLLKAGRSDAGQRSVRTHTAALGDTPAALAGAFRQHGIVQVRDLDELADTVMLADRCPPTSGSRIGVFSLAGGGTGLIADIAADHGFAIPDLTADTTATLEALLPSIAVVKNPLDPTAGFARNAEQHRRALQAMAADPGIDVIIHFPLAAQVEYAQQLADDIVAVSLSIAKPILCIWTAGRHLEPGAWRTLHESGVPLFTSTSACFRALANLRDWSVARERLGSDAAADLGAQHGQSAAGLKGEAMLQAFGVRLAASTIADTAAAAVVAAQQVGGPVVLKVVSPDIPHKTEAGGVRVGVAADEVAATFDHIMRTGAAYAPGAHILGVEVQELVPPGVEMLVGVTTDDQLGPMVMVGMGGVLAEVLDDVAMRPAPVSRADVEEMVAELRGAPMLGGVRGRPPADVAAFVDLVLSVSALADAVRARDPEIDVNPVVVLPEGSGAVAVDHLVHLR